MYEVIKVNGEWLPRPDEDLDFNAEKVKSESETEAGTTMVQVTRDTKLTISGSWTLSGHKIKKFREYRAADTVKVEVYYPDPFELSEYECQFEIEKETHKTVVREQIPESGGVYEVSVKIKEL